MSALESKFVPKLELAAELCFPPVAVEYVSLPSPWMVAAAEPRAPLIPARSLLCLHCALVV